MFAPRFSLSPSLSLRLTSGQFPASPAAPAPVGRQAEGGAESPRWVGRDGVRSLAPAVSLRPDRGGPAAAARRPAFDTALGSSKNSLGVSGFPLP